MSKVLLLNTAKIDGMHNSPCQSTNDCTTQTFLTETLSTTKFIEVTSHTDSDSSEKILKKQLFLLLAQNDNLSRVRLSKEFLITITNNHSSLKKQSIEQDNLKTCEKNPQKLVLVLPLQCK